MSFAFLLIASALALPVPNPMETVAIHGTEVKLNTINIPIDPAAAKLLGISTVPISLLPMYLGGMEMDVSGNTMDAAVLASIRETITANMRRSLQDIATNELRKRALGGCLSIGVSDIDVTIENVKITLDPIDTAPIAAQLGVPFKFPYIGFYPVEIEKVQMGVPNFSITSDVLCSSPNRILEDDSNRDSGKKEQPEHKPTTPVEEGTRSLKANPCGRVTVPLLGMKMQVGRMAIDARMLRQPLPTIVLSDLTTNMPPSNLIVDLQPMCTQIGNLSDKVLQQLLTEVFGADTAKEIMGTLGKVWDAALDVVDDIIDWINKLPTPWRRASAFDIDYSIAIPSSVMTVYDGVTPRSANEAVRVDFASFEVDGTEVQLDPIRIRGFSARIPSFRIKATLLKQDDVDAFMDVTNQILNMNNLFV